MTDRMNRWGCMMGVHRLCTGRAALRDLMGVLVIGVCLAATSVRADGWQEFQSRCLAAYEVLTAPVLTDLQQITHAELSTDAYSQDAIAYGPTDMGEVVIVDPAPLLDGDRSCAVTGGVGDRAEIAQWIAAQVETERYEVRREGAATILMSLEWIEPRLQVTLVLEGPDAGTYSVLETYLES